MNALPELFAHGGPCPLSPRCARHFPQRGRHAGGASPSPAGKRGQGAAPPWLPLTRELSAQLTEGEKNRRFCKTSLFSPSVKTCGFATSLVRGRRKFSPAWQRPRCGRCSPPIASLCSALPPMGEAWGKTSSAHKKISARAFAWALKVIVLRLLGEERLTRREPSASSGGRSEPWRWPRRRRRACRLSRGTRGSDGCNGPRSSGTPDSRPQAPCCRG